MKAEYFFIDAWLLKQTIKGLYVFLFSLLDFQYFKIIHFTFRVNYLDKQVEGKIPQVRQEDWQPFFTYRNSLMQGETDWNPITLKQAAQKRYGRKNRQDSKCVNRPDS